MYNNIHELLCSAAEKQLPLYEVILQNEMALTDATRAEVLDKLRTRWHVMQKSCAGALYTPQEMPGSLIAGQSGRQQQYTAAGHTLSGTKVNQMMALALSASEVNAGMGRICAAPTAGSCGVLPAVVQTAAARTHAGEEQILQALLVAAGFGAVITKNATVSGAEGGCQAECGTAAAMAAAAAVTLANGTPQMCANAAAIALINCMGLICDPVAGLVQLPCSFRNASQSVNALTSADMALAGQSSVIPVDEVIDAMYRVGKKLPSELRETAQGGIAACQTAKAIAAQLYKGE